MSRSPRCTWGSRPACAYEMGVTSKMVVSHSNPLPQVIPARTMSHRAPASRSTFMMGGSIEDGIDGMKERRVTVEPVSIERCPGVHVGSHFDENPGSVRVAVFSGYVKQ